MALGRGLGELLGEVENAYENNVGTSNISEIQINLIKPNPYQPRKIFNKEKLQELASSIKSQGLLQPIVVKKSDDGYILVAGERRLKAVELNGEDFIQAVIIDIDDNKLREYALIENIQRDDLNILEIAISFASLINEYKITHEELSKIVHKSRSTITNILRLLNLSDYAKKALLKDDITQGHARVLVGLDDELQKKVIDTIVGQKLSVRETEKLIKTLKTDTKPKTKQLELNFKPLDNIFTKLKEDGLKVKIKNNTIQIVVNSQHEIEKLQNFFKK
jgi:ParB family chromosome partitioning protein